MPSPPVEKKKIIRDVVHGYITLTKNDVSIIDTPRFQRLKRIHQTGATSVYPCANHTRFEHSLGVMHLGSSVFQVLKKQEPSIDNEKYENTVKYACLLHDIGHAPFSHLGESFYNQKELQKKVHECLESLGIKSDFTGQSAAHHELCSCAIALEYYNKELSENKVDFDLFCRMITGETYRVGENNIADCLIAILNSDIDVDKLDYILRDSFMSGAKLVSLDVDRIINSYLIYQNALAFSGQALSTISNLIYGRDALYSWVYNHHITVYTDCLYKRLIERVIKKTGNDKFFSYDAISKDLIDDYHLISFIRENLTGDLTSQNLYNQLFHRQFYKSIWKNPVEFNLLISDPGHQDTFIFAVGQNRNHLEKLEKSIIDKTPGLSEGDFFISLAYFKPFTPIAGKSIYIVVNKDKRIRFQEIFEEQIYKVKKAELPFVFVKNDTVKGIILKKINDSTFN